jgi:hypothetical protein
MANEDYSICLARLRDGYSPQLHTDFSRRDASGAYAACEAIPSLSAAYPHAPGLMDKSIIASNIRFADLSGPAGKVDNFVNISQ